MANTTISNKCTLSNSLAWCPSHPSDHIAYIESLFGSPAPSFSNWCKIDPTCPSKKDTEKPSSKWCSSCFIESDDERTNEFYNIKEIVPEKVYEFTFGDGTKIKNVLSEEDFFDLEYGFYLALAKKLYSKTYTFEGVICKSFDLYHLKYTKKIVEKGLKLFKKIQEDEAKAEEAKAIKERQHKKYVEKKIRAKERKRKEQINMIAEAIRLSKDGED